jgi:hypothetical protein
VPKGGSMRLGLFGPSRQEVDALAHDLIVRHGLDAYDEAIRLSEIVQLLPRSIRQRRLYELAAERIEQSFEIARETRSRVGDHSIDGEGPAPDSPPRASS